MDRAELASRIDHTALGPTTTPGDVERLVGEATKYGTNACVPPCYVSLASDRAPDVTLVTVVGFPHGQHDPETKREEAVRAHSAGADEIDLVANVGRLTAGERAAVADEIETVVDAVPVPVKVIVEAPLLIDAEKRAAGEIAREAGADYLKTSTGFVEGGATVADVELLSAYLPVKASGGIGTWEEAEAMLEAGAERIGASSGIEILEDFDATGE